MSTRRDVIRALPAAGAAFAVAGNLILDESPARAQAAAPLKGHFHPKGKAPSKFTIEALQKARATLPFADTRDFDENKRGLLAPMPDMKIMADAGHVAWDMERFKFIDQQEEFDSIPFAAPDFEAEQQLRTSTRLSRESIRSAGSTCRRSASSADEPDGLFSMWQSPVR